MNLKHLTLAALLLGNATPAPVPNPQPQPAPIDGGQIASTAMRGLTVCAVPYLLHIRQQGLDQAKLEETIKSADKNWEERLKEATSMEEKTVKDQKDSQKAGTGAQGQASSSSASSSNSATVTPLDPRCPHAFTTYWKFQRANHERMLTKRPTASSWNSRQNTKLAKATEQCSTNLLIARSKFMQQNDIYRKKYHNQARLPDEDLWKVDVEPQTLADVEYSIKQGCIYAINGVEPEPLPEMAAAAAPAPPPSERGSRQEQTPLLPLYSTGRRGSNQQLPTAPIPQERLTVPASAAPRAGGPSTQQSQSPAGTSAGSSAQSKTPPTPPGSPKESSSKPSTPKGPDQSGSASAADGSKGKGKLPAGTAPGSLARTPSGLGGRPASLGSGAVGDKQPDPLTKGDRQRTW
ncbi:uncharacterized protein PpBr36_10080 [Pyricularia pennisetigena]|uniref:uncharacterized protein n=1 Tax=Pyricularia pennisetigena TaxID=1578925 RepID=UPI001154073D|nr:uncharacterized protein PpBr36_10080 [Pyricularia pennisetigena]TLS22387.1 hypothetical protein PpBr36_10080 [Pyricularia pennisetigena]